MKSKFRCPIFLCSTSFTLVISCIIFICHAFVGPISILYFTYRAGYIFKDTNSVEGCTAAKQHGQDLKKQTERTAQLESEDTWDFKF